MAEITPKLTALLALAALGVSACGSAASPSIPPSAVLKRVSGSRAGRIVLSSVGEQRIGVETAVVRRGRGRRTLIIPYSSVIYAPDGNTYAFINQSPLTFTEVPIAVARIDGASAYLNRGPRPGARVVTVGAEELFGVQTGVLPQT
jgi:hypothetical protein